MSRRLDDLEAVAFRPRAMELIARLAEAGIPVFIVSTGRTQAEQDEAFRTGHSKVRHSKHQDGLAIDICPYRQYIIHGERKLQWNTSDPVWKDIGRIAESLGLRWGGRFGESAPGAGDGWDPGHAEMRT